MNVFCLTADQCPDIAAAGMGMPRLKNDRFLLEAILCVLMPLNLHKAADAPAKSIKTGIRVLMHPAVVTLQYLFLCVAGIRMDMALPFLHRAGKDRLCRIAGFRMRMGALAHFFSAHAGLGIAALCMDMSTIALMKAADDLRRIALGPMLMGPSPFLLAAGQGSDKAGACVSWVEGNWRQVLM